MNLYRNGTTKDGNPAYLKRDVKAFGAHLCSQLNSGEVTPDELAGQYGTNHCDGEIYMGSGELAKGYFELSLVKGAKAWKATL